MDSKFPVENLLFGVGVVLNSFEDCCSQKIIYRNSGNFHVKIFCVPNSYLKKILCFYNDLTRIQLTSCVENILCLIL